MHVARKRFPDEAPALFDRHARLADLVRLADSLNTELPDYNPSDSLRAPVYRPRPFFRDGFEWYTLTQVLRYYCDVCKFVVPRTASMWDTGLHDAQALYVVTLRSGVDVLLEWTDSGVLFRAPDDPATLLASRPCSIENIDMASVALLRAASEELTRINKDNQPSQPPPDPAADVVEIETKARELARHFRRLSLYPSEIQPADADAAPRPPPLRKYNDFFYLDAF